MMIATNKSPREALQEYFGFDKFKGQQEAIINSVLEGKDTFVIMPTGGGKSLCYQLPAMMMPGTAIVISPLIALMKNQVDSIRGHSKDDEIAHFLNSSLTKAQMKKVKSDIADGKTKVLFIAPETLTKDTKITEVFSFPAPAETDMVAKLMLPKEAIGRETGPFGFEIPRTTWLAGVSPESAPPPAAIDPAPGAVPSDPAPMPETQPESMPENMPETKPEPMPKPDTNENPPSITDLIRKSVEKDKDAKKDAPDKDAPK